jgi:hypothetical protein
MFRRRMDDMTGGQCPLAAPGHALRNGLVTPTIVLGDIAQAYAAVASGSS